jgi:hypothetical protein
MCFPRSELGCCECEKDGDDPILLSTFECVDPACDLPSLCDGHAMVHQTWGHALKAVVPKEGPASDQLLGVTYCAKPDHAGPSGRLSHVCRTCDRLECEHCALDSHGGAGHDVISLMDAGAEARRDLQGLARALLDGVRFQRELSSRCRDQLHRLDAARSAIVGEVRRRHDALAHQLRLLHDEVVECARQAYEAKQCAVLEVLASARSASGQLATLAAATDLVLEHRNDLAAVHLRRSVHCALALANDRDERPVDTTLELTADGRAPVLPLGHVAVYGTASAQPSAPPSEALGGQDCQDTGSALGVVPEIRLDFHPPQGDLMPFECPGCGNRYDCQQRAPVSAACPCRRTVCRKCAGVAASHPNPSPCFVCGRHGAMDFSIADCCTDVGLLWVLASGMAATNTYAGRGVRC